MFVTLATTSTAHSTEPPPNTNDNFDMYNFMFLTMFTLFVAIFTLFVAMFGHLLWHCITTRWTTLRSAPQVPELTEEGQTSEDELPPLVQLEENYAQTDEDRPLLTTLVQLRRRERELEYEIADLKKQLLWVNIKSKDLCNKINRKLQGMVEVHNYQFEQMRFRYEKELKERTRNRSECCRQRHLPHRIR